MKPTRHSLRAEGLQICGVLGALIAGTIAPASFGSATDIGARTPLFVAGQVIVLSASPERKTLPPDTAERAGLKLLFCIGLTGDCVYKYPLECGSAENVAARLSKEITSCRVRPTFRGRFSRQQETRWKVVPNAILTTDLPETMDTSDLALLSADPDERLVKQTELLRIGAKSAWVGVSADPDVITAVIDTGVQLDHPDLATQLEPGTTIPCITNPCYGGAIDIPHGTMMAGTIAAARGNGGIVGAAWNTHLLPIKITDDLAQTDDANAAKGIAYALSHGARVLNLSFNSDARTTAVERALSSATQPFLLMVPAGNQSRDIDASGQKSFPASLMNKQKIMVVMSHDPQDRRENSSSWGKQTVDIAAPGTVYSSKICAGSVCYTRSSDSTSNATSYVSGAAALLWSKYPAWSPAAVRWRILENARRLDELGDYLDSPRGLDLERMMFPLKYFSATGRQIDKATLHSLDLTQPIPSTVLDTGTAFPPDMCKSVTVELVRSNSSPPTALTPATANAGDVVHFRATCQRATGADYVAESIDYDVAD